MSEMQKMGMDAPKRGRPRNEVSAPPTEPRAPRAPRVEISTSDETFNLIAKSLLNVSEQIPMLVRDCADIRVDNSEIKQMIYQLSNNIAALQQDIAYIVSSISHLVAPPTPLTQRMKLGVAQSDEEMPSILTRLQGVENGKK